MHPENKTTKIFSHRLLLIFAIVLGACLRLYQLGYESFGPDESLYESYIHCTLKHLLTTNIEPLFFLMVRYWGKLFGNSEIQLRLSSVLFGTASIFWIYKLSKHFFSEKNSLISAYLLAINPFAIHSSQSLRFENFYLFLALISNYYFFEIFKKANLKYEKYFILFSVAAIYSHPFSFFLYFSFFINYVLGRYFKIISVEINTFIKIFSKITLFAAPIALYTIYATLDSYIKVGTVDVRYASPLETLLLPSIYFYDQKIGIIICGLLYSNFLYLASKKPKQEIFIFAFSSFISTYFIPWIISFLIVPILVFKFTSAALIYFILLTSWVIGNSNNLISKLLSTSILMLNFFTFYDYYTKPNLDLWREAANFLEIEVKKGDMIIANPSYFEQILKYYLSNDLDNKIINHSDNLHLASKLIEAERIWLVTSHDPEENIELANSLNKFGNETKINVVTKQASNGTLHVSGYPIQISLREKNNKKETEFFK